MTAVFLSDVHLLDSSSVKTKLVTRFLQEVAANYERIYILGDLFDVWPGTNEFLIQNYQSVIDVLGQLVKDGVKIHYVEGNHDFRLGEYFSKTLGIDVHPDHWEETWGERRIYMAHGDLGNPKEVGYRVLRRFLRLDWLHLAVRQMPGEWLYQVGRKTSQVSRQMQSLPPERVESIRTVYRTTAHGLFEKGYDVVIMGHTHIPDDYTAQVGSRTCRYFNTGDWVRNFTYLEFNGTDFYTKSHPVTL